MVDRLGKVWRTDGLKKYLYVILIGLFLASCVSTATKCENVCAKTKMYKEGKTYTLTGTELRNMKKRIFSVLAIMCSKMLIMTGCGGASDTDVNNGGINAEDNTMKFSELFQKDVIAYFGTLKDDEIAGKDQKIYQICSFHSDGLVTEYFLGYSTGEFGSTGESTLGELEKMKNDQLEQSLVFDDIGTEGIYVDGELGVTQNYDDGTTEG